MTTENDDLAWTEVARFYLYEASITDDFDERRKLQKKAESALRRCLNPETVRMQLTGTVYRDDIPQD